MKKQVKISSFSTLLIIAALFGNILLQNSCKQESYNKIDYSSQIRTEKRKYDVEEGKRFPVRLKLKNTGTKTWETTGPNACYLSYHLLDANGNILAFDNRRFHLPKTVIPNESINMILSIRSPLEQGEYILEFDLLREGIAWFKDNGSPTTKISVEVKKKIWPEDEVNIDLDFGKYTKVHSTVPEFNKTAKLIRLTLAHNEVSFQGKTGEIHGFSAGTDYPQIWLRDANTILPASQYFYEKPFLCSWLEEHLAYQKSNGSLEDWVDSVGNSDKNTTETDQESSTVQAAHQVFKLLGPQWLDEKTQGESIINRLENALIFVLKNRFNTHYCLLTGAHTADWGDIDLIDDDEQAVYVDERTHWTIDIYDQSMFYQACLNLSEMFRSLGQNNKADFWAEQASTIKTNTNRWLWQKERGFYRVHLHLDSLRHDFEEDDILAMGGNTAAMLSGLASEQQCRQIIQEIIKRQKSLGLSTISGTLLPPYPKNVFKHPLLDEPFEYQNGAQWDWFGGRLICVLFKNGFSSIAKEKLKEIIHKNLTNRGFFEWENTEGTPRGSDYYCGSAGSIGKALFEGYFGIKMGYDSLCLEPNLGMDSGKIHAYQPSNGKFVAYSYDFDPKNDLITFCFNSNFTQTGTIKILSPWLILNHPPKEIRKKIHVAIDGKSIDYEIIQKFNDIFIVFESDFNNHTVKISLLQ
ncbi:MAG: hypothetical protein IBX60_02170 [Candidatus Aminicenantes bacterium]|nr:hypothetical protein [Candidatus Aminicenantes bacterium]